MPEREYKTIDSQTEFQGEIITVMFDRVLLPDGLIHNREYVRHPGAVGIVPVTEDMKALLVKQYRHATNAELWEIPAGKLDAGESPQGCAMRELEEETGLTGDLTPIGAFYTTPGYSDEMFYLYKATRLTGTHRLPHDEEIIEHKYIDLNDALKMIKDGIIADGKTICGLCLALLDVMSAELREMR